MNGAEELMRTSSSYSAIEKVFVPLVHHIGGVVDQNVDATHFLGQCRHGLFGARKVVQIAPEIAHPGGDAVQQSLRIHRVGPVERNDLAPSSA